MTEKPKLSIRKPLSLNKQSQIFQGLKPLHEQKQKEKDIKQKKRKVIKETIAWLNKQFPACFDLKNLKPLKLNIDKDLYPFLEKSGSPSKAKLREALTYYTNSLYYLKTIINETYRYDLKGQEVEEITPEHKAFAQEKLDKILRFMENKKLRTYNLCKYY